jgi:hypothetical protein
MTWVIKNQVTQQAINETSTTQKQQVGLVVDAQDDGGTIAGQNLGGGRFVYLKGVASTQVGTLVSYDPFLNTTTIVPATGAPSGPAAVSMSANVANQFGWYAVEGTVPVRAPNAMVVGANVFMLAATPGSVDDAVVAGEQVLNAVAASTTGTPSAGLALVTLARPFVQGQIT